MGFISFDKQGRLLDSSGKPIHLVGINYVASYICSNFWADWRPDVIESDLRRISEMGLQAIRIPWHWGFMEPEPGKYNPVFEKEFAEFMDMARRYGLYVMPWMLIGIATRDYDVPFRNGRSFFGEEMTEIAVNHIRHFIVPYKDDESILYWDLCDEIEWHSRFPGTDKLPYDRLKVLRWVQAIYDAARSVDPNHMITLGFGHIGNQHYGMDVRDMAKILDLMAVTAYPDAAHEGLDTLRNSYTVPYHVKINKRGVNVFTCEAPGMSSIHDSEDCIGRYFRTSLHSNAVNGSTGVMPWVYADFKEELWHSVPFDKYCIEPCFGIFTADGRMKPSGKELRDFAAFAKKAELGKYLPQKAKVGIVIPEGYYSREVGNVYRKVMATLQYVKGSGLDADLVWINEDFSPYQVLMLPATAGWSVTTPDWDKLRRFVEAGGTLYHVNDGGQNGYFNRLFGVEVQCSDSVNYDQSRMIAQQDWGQWRKGDVVDVDRAVDKRPLVTVTPKEACVLFALEDGIPLLLRNRYGRGTCYLMTLPLDSDAMQIPYRKYLDHISFRLVRAILEDAGIRSIARVHNIAMETGCMKDCETGKLLLFLINHDNAPVDAKVTVDVAQIPAGWSIREFETGKRVELDGATLHLDAAGVRVYTVEPENA